MLAITLSLVAAQCVTIGDESPGWKQVALPSNRPALAAPPVYEQFRSNELAVVTSTTSELFRSSSHAGPGRFRFEFSVPPGARSFTVKFDRPLDGAKVDAVLDGPRGSLTLLDEKRFGGNELTLATGLPDATRLIVTVHHHLRDAPVLSIAEATSHLTPAQSELFPEPFRTENALFVLSTGGPISLCDRPGQPMVVAARSLQRRTVRAVALGTR